MIPEFWKVVTTLVLIFIAVFLIDVLFDINLIVVIKSALLRIGIRS